jgi:hypothetical protein
LSRAVARLSPGSGSLQNGRNVPIQETMDFVTFAAPRIGV